MSTPSLRLLAAITVVSVAATACGTDPHSESNPALAAAEAFCPIMWAWVKDVGGAFNRAASDVATIEPGVDRRARWMAAFDEIGDLNDALLAKVAPYADDPILGPLVDEVETDMPRAAAELDDIRQMFVDHPEVDEQRHQARTMQVIVRMEKVVDLPKPDLGVLDVDGTLLPAFRQVPSCQHSIRDVDDGTPQANG